VELIDRIGLEDTEIIEDLTEKYSRLAEPYPQEPFQVVKRRVARLPISFGEADLIFGSGVVMDTSAWLISSEG